jgi:putative addiction module component (TIGR02574 family)
VPLASRANFAIIRDTRIIDLLVRLRSRNSLSTVHPGVANFSIITLAPGLPGLHSAGGDAILPVMNERVKKLSEEIRKLSAEERADLLDELVILVHSEPDAEIDKAWVEEANRRWEAYLRGEVQTVPAEEVFAKLGTKRGKAR